MQLCIGNSIQQNTCAACWMGDLVLISIYKSDRQTDGHTDDTVAISAYPHLTKNYLDGLKENVLKTKALLTEKHYNIRIYPV